jgi:hypothetical protein
VSELRSPGGSVRLRMGTASGRHATPTFAKLAGLAALTRAFAAATIQNRRQRGAERSPR